MKGSNKTNKVEKLKVEFCKTLKSTSKIKCFKETWLACTYLIVSLKL